MDPKELKLFTNETWHKSLKVDGWLVVELFSLLRVGWILKLIDDG